MVSLDTETAEIAKSIGVQYRAHGGFSTWLRNQLRSYRNRTENDDVLKANTARQVESVANISSAELLWHLEQRSPEEIGALISILKNGLA